MKLGRRILIGAASFVSIRDDIEQVFMRRRFAGKIAMRTVIENETIWLPSYQKQINQMGRNQRPARRGEVRRSREKYYRASEMQRSSSQGKIGEAPYMKAVKQAKALTSLEMKEKTSQPSAAKRERAISVRTRP